MIVYKQQVALLLQVLPEVAKEKCFALHGGTAINLFVRNMPRLSVDIDLTYTQIEDRDTTFKNIQIGLQNIKDNINKIDSSIKVQLQAEQLKLLVNNAKASIKVEVNQGMRGIIGEVEIKELCQKAQEKFDAFCAVPCVPMHQLYGGKICAAIDRQHPRDIFDVKYFLENEKFTDKIKKGFLFCLLCSKGPIVEMLSPLLKNQEQAYNNQFAGMATESFSYEDFCNTRYHLVELIQQSLNEYDKEFLIQFESGMPDWTRYNFSDFPAVNWKLLNKKKLKEMNPEKHNQEIEKLKLFLESLEQQY